MALKKKKTREFVSEKKTPRKMKHNLSKREFADKVTGSRWSGVPFPAGTKRKVFEIYCQFDGNVSKTRKYLKDNKILDEGRVPNLLTLQKWAVEGHWKVLKEVVDDGILKVMELEEDPDIQDVIRDDAALAKFLLRLRSGLYAKMMEKGSVLEPQNSREALAVLTHIKDMIDPYSERLATAKKRQGIQSVEGDLPEVPDNVASITKLLKDRGEVPTKENISREILKIKEAKNAK